MRDTRYSPCATTTNQPTNRVLNEAAGPMCAQESIFWAKFGRFWAKIPHFYGRKQNFLHPHNAKPARHLLRIIFGRAWDQMGQKGQYSAQNDQECIIWAKFGHFCTKNLNFNGRKQKFGTHITEKSPSHLVPMPILGQIYHKGIIHCMKH